MRKILHVEDNENQVRLLQNAFTHWQLEGVRTKAQAVERVQNGQYDAVIADLELPDAHGLDIIEALAPITDAPIIVYSGRCDDAMALRAITAGAEDVLFKGEFSVRHMALAVRYAVARFNRRRLEEVQVEQQISELTGQFKAATDRNIAIAKDVRELGTRLRSRPA